MLQTVQYGAINTAYTDTMGYYIIKLLEVASTLQEDTTFDGIINTSGEIFFKAEYMNFIQYNTKWYQMNTTVI